MRKKNCSGMITAAPYYQMVVYQVYGEYVEGLEDDVEESSIISGSFFDKTH